MIRQLRDADAEQARRWDEFVQGAEDGTFFHLSGWMRVLKEAFSHPTHYLYAERDGQICGVLPLAHVKSFLFGNSLISTPFCVYGGVVSTDETTRVALTEHACMLAKQLQVDYLELRNRSAQNPGWPTKDLYVTFRKNIADNDEDNLKAIPRKQRAMVRKGIKAGLQSHASTDIEHLYECYTESVRNLGTPVFSRRYLEVLLDVFGAHTEILSVTHEDKPVAAVLSFFFRDEVLPYYGGGKASARNLKGNDFMYWAVMTRAVAQGKAVFDYGRSKLDTGSYRFKKHWGFEPQTMAYEYFLVNADAMPNLSPTNPKYRLFIGLWQRMPVALANRIGPWVARYLG